ncbi:hypothetical protein B0H16DRAFT_1449806 [Mycena metata]|uniref:Uncharacterized protein n=1 Tax=Mycena metata TaxID=1033252 RepID=A0AAD7K3K8_9AGAR|nr:hypothetical protein B0H16DRAFT_1449806 [Mycena metata]
MKLLMRELSEDKQHGMYLLNKKILESALYDFIVRTIGVVGVDWSIQYSHGRQPPDFYGIRIEGGCISLGTQLWTRGAIHEKMTVRAVMWIDKISNMVVIQCWSSRKIIHLAIPFWAIYWVAMPFEIPNRKT